MMDLMTVRMVGMTIGGIAIHVMAIAVVTPVGIRHGGHTCFQAKQRTLDKNNENT